MELDFQLSILPINCNHFTIFERKLHIAFEDGDFFTRCRTSCSLELTKPHLCRLTRLDDLTFRNIIC